MTDHLAALAMRTKAAAHCNDMATSRESTPKQGMAYRSAAKHILALPIEADHAALLAEAVKVLRNWWATVDQDHPDMSKVLKIIAILNSDENDRFDAALLALETP